MKSGQTISKRTETLCPSTTRFRARAGLEALLGDGEKMKKLIGDERKEDAKNYGDDRRCAIKARPPAAALVTTEILPAEPVTVVLSKAGWIRAGKGHELDPTALSYKSGDEFAYADRKSTRLNSSH